MSDDDDEENAAAIEVELLLGMYTDNECEIIQDEGTTTFCLHLVPHSAGGHLSSFCKLSLKLILNNKSYPDEPPIISFQTARGLAEAKAKTGKGKPVVILMKTDMGHGVDFMSGTHKWHGKPPNDEQRDIALAQLEETLGDYPL